MATSTRIFSFGLGASPSRSLVKGLARTTNGRFVFIPPNTSIDSYVGEQLQRAIRRCITNIRVEWNLGIPVENVPNQLPPAYIDDRLIIYSLTNNNQTIALNPKSSIEIRTDSSYYRLGITDSDRITNHNQMIARLAAKALIRELEHSKIPRNTSRQTRFEHFNNYSKDHIKQRIIDLSLRYNILSPYTAFIGIEKRLHTGNNNNMILREVPIQISADNQDSQLNNARVEKHLLQIDRVSSYPSARSTTDRTTTSSVRSTADRKITRSANHDEFARYDRMQESLKYADKTASVPISATTSSVSQSSNVHYHRRYRLAESQNETDDQNTVHYLLDKQFNDGLWNFTSNKKTIQDLTGKPLTVFQSSEIHHNTQILITAIIIVLLESNFIALQSVWSDAVEKARNRLINLLNNDWKKLIILLRNIRIILNG